MNNLLLEQAQKWLTELDIKTEAAGTFLKVSRDGMIVLSGGDDESSPTIIIKELKDTISKKFYWSGKDDDWFFLSCF